MPSFSPCELHTERLTLRFIDGGDADALFRLFSDPQALRYWSSGPWLHMAQAADNIEQTLKGYQDGAALRLALVLPDGELIGTATLYAFDRRNHRCEIGYMLARPYWGQRYMQEALAALIGYGFGALELHRIEADIHPDNIASGRILEGLQFRQEGHLRERWFVGGEISDSIIYGLLRRDWIGPIHPAQ
ncbi:GNAT family N-acetyltransferase [Duganella aceris]|uniref:GNAT family N-acetyltransferase n=1 Tax=Duganella aceris TaxID=2703883 RepID=A0ABX0FMM9_9BURK|nr:GNAT family N-acetyltransferase [Duganella aceris]NGZ85869.1 GNAT family N-acetyltransferase [Duganella aceris]